MRLVNKFLYILTLHNIFILFTHTNLKKIEIGDSSCNMNASYKTAIKYKDLSISVKMFKVNKDSGIELNQLCKDSNERIRYKKYCSSCNKEITNEDIIKGYQYTTSPVKYVTISEDELNSLKSNNDSYLNVKYFCKSKEIDDLLINRSYHLVPEINSEIKYALFYKVLATSKIVAITEIVLGTKQELIALTPKNSHIVANVLFYQNEINELSNMCNHKVVKSDYINLKELISKDIKKFNWPAHFDSYQLKLKELILSKIPK